MNKTKTQHIWNKLTATVGAILQFSIWDASSENFAGSKDSKEMWREIYQSIRKYKLFILEKEMIFPLKHYETYAYRLKAKCQVQTILNCYKHTSFYCLKYNLWLKE